MGDMIKNNAIFTKLGFDSTNQWLLYHEPMRDFFDWFAKNITENNILTDNEILMEAELKSNGTWCDGDELESQLNNLEKNYPGILTYTEQDVKDLERKVEQLEEIEKMYADLNKQAESTKSDLRCELSNLEYSISENEDRKEKAYNECMTKAKKLIELQQANVVLNNELISCHTKPQMPPLFIHQMPLEDYYAKCDSFMQHIKTYVDGNLKTRTSLENDSDVEEQSSEVIEELEKLRLQLYSAEIKLIELKLEGTGAYQKIIEELDINKVHVLNIAQIKKEIRELDMDNKHLNFLNETLMNDLKVNLQQLAQQQIEFVLYENTKHKLERATQRLENVKNLSRHISDALHNADILWILMQLDIDKIKDQITNPIVVSNDSSACAKRIELMLQYQSIPKFQFSSIYINRMSDILTEYLQLSQKPNSIKTCLYEYERASRLSMYALKSIIAKKHCTSKLNALDNIKSVEETYSRYIFDGPIDGPVFESMKFLVALYEAKRDNESIKNAIRKMRSDIQENITEKMKTNRFWRFQRVLWIWFLTEPKKVLQAIEEIKEASKVPNSKALCGIKRKE